MKKKMHHKQGKDIDTKLRELVLLIATLSEGDEPFGKIKLNKLMFFADFTAYRHLGKSITGHEYIRKPHGPVPKKLIQVIPALGSSSKTDPDIFVRKQDYYGNDLYRPIAKRIPDISWFTFPEIKIIENVVKEWRGKSAKDISEISHRFAGWSLAKPGESIPYEVALVGRRREPTDHELIRGKSLAQLIARKATRSKPALH